MRVFLTGGSGYLGRSVLAALARHGIEAAALARSDASAAVVTSLGATAVRGELTDVDVLRRAAAEADGAIHLGAGTGPDAPRHILDAARAMQEGLGDRGTYVHTGGVWVYGDTDGVADEEAPQRPPRVAAWLQGNERTVLAAADRGGRPVLVMPGVVYGHGAGLPTGFFTEPGRSTGAVPVIGDGANHWSVVHVDDIAELYVLALGAAPGSRYAGVAENLRLADIVQALSVAAGHPGSIEQLTVDQAVERMGPVAEAFALDQRFTSARARRELGWAPAHLDALTELAEEPAT
ncbi:NAD-dependent epimerase/dehydratase family protein [Streptomyces sp. NBC_01190]|uniref:NAD-dependent epimerase/dehydratase family protein n=1 Tax=Streptomyces sp. NBC_01190 TaxID=2903767 RepID=UPI00386B93DD|nr:NAD-dependent epimerase/dehydratase family protein [Streptomyces sp. NBC_01190]